MSNSVGLLLTVVHFSREGPPRLLCGEHQPGSLLSGAIRDMWTFTQFFHHQSPSSSLPLTMSHIPKSGSFPPEIINPVLCECGDWGINFLKGFQTFSIFFLHLPPPLPFMVIGTVISRASVGLAGVIQLAHVNCYLCRHFGLNLLPSAKSYVIFSNVFYPYAL